LVQLARRLTHFTKSIADGTAEVGALLVDARFGYAVDGTGVAQQHPSKHRDQKRDPDDMGGVVRSE
jgi:hypothetical protein